MRSEVDVADSRQQTLNLRIIEACWQNILVTLVECPCLGGPPLVIRPDLGSIVLGDKNHGVSSRLLVNLNQMVVEILAPKVRLLEGVVETLTPLAVSPSAII